MLTCRLRVRPSVCAPYASLQPDGPDAASSPTLAALAEYNRDDCESTRQLADWLWTLRTERCPSLRIAGAVDGADPGADTKAGIDGSLGDDEPGGEATATPASDEEAELVRLEDALSADEGWAAGTPLALAEVRETLRGMLRYHQREAKPQWWRRFDWLSKPPSELAAETRTLGGLIRTATAPYKTAPRKRRLAYEYCFEAQDCHLAAGASIVLRDDEAMGDWPLSRTRGGAPSDGGNGDAAVDGEGPSSIGATLTSIDRAKGIAVIECGVEPPDAMSALPNEFVDASPIARGLRSHVAAMLTAPTERTAIGDLLARRVPILDGAPNSGAPVTEAQAAAAEAHAVDGQAPTLLDITNGRDPLAAAVSAVVSLRSSYLVVQGPPGTGKTYTAAQCIAALVARRRRVGVMAVSHRAITHLMARAVAAVADGSPRDGMSDGQEPGSPISCVALKLGGPASDLGELKAACDHKTAATTQGSMVSVEHLRGASALRKRDGLAEDELLVGGTAWAFASDELRGKLDVLFVDEAGQLPLAQLAGAARSAESVVLMGDQMQLPAPSEGHHPGQSGASCLEYLLRGAECVPPSMGIFLPTTYRMHPRLCSLVSALSYRGMLTSHASTATREIELPPAAPGSPPALLQQGTGIAFVPVQHEGNSQSAPEEVQALAMLCKELCQCTLRQGNDQRTPITPDQILVVAPYNLQARVLPSSHALHVPCAPPHLTDAMPMCCCLQAAQVRALQASLPAGVRVGTVDRFQGQEAPVVLLSLCHSDFHHATAAEQSGSDTADSGGGDRGLSFVLNTNRLNVALSRAQCLAVVVGSPRLADTPPRTLLQQRQLNVLCRIVEDTRRANEFLEGE